MCDYAAVLVKAMANKIQQPEPPKTVDEAVDRLIADLPFRSKTNLSNLSKSDLSDLKLTLGQHIKNKFRLDTGNKDLLEGCRDLTKDKYLHHSQAPFVIIKALWEKLKKTHKLRVVK